MPLWISSCGGKCLDHTTLSARTINQLFFEIIVFYLAILNIPILLFTFFCFFILPRLLCSLNYECFISIRLFILFILLSNFCLSQPYLIQVEHRIHRKTQYRRENGTCKEIETHLRRNIILQIPPTHNHRYQRIQTIF